MSGSCEPAATLSSISFAVCPDYSSLICGGGGKLDKKTDGGAAFEYFPFSECRSEADAATLELWNNRPGTVRSAESLKTQLLKQQPLFKFIFDLNEILFQVQRFYVCFPFCILCAFFIKHFVVNLFKSCACANADLYDYLFCKS